MTYLCSTDEASSATILVKKLVAVLESTEKLPLLTYECPGSGLQVCESYSCKLSVDYELSLIFGEVRRTSPAVHRRQFFFADFLHSRDRLRQREENFRSLNFKMQQA